MPTPENIVQEISRRRDESDGRVQAFWVQVAGDRVAFVEQLNELGASVPLVALVVRGHLFENANAVGEDVADLLTEARPKLLARDEQIAACGYLGLVLVSRTELGIPQVASPVALPSWFPLRPGELAPILIRDLTWSASVPLNAPEAQIPDLCSRLFSVEGVVLDRLAQVSEIRRVAGQHLFDLIKERTEARDYSAFLEEARAYRSLVKNSNAFRPSLREAKSLVANLWSLGLSSAPDKTQSRARKLCEALGADGEDLVPIHVPIVAILQRPTQPDDSGGHELARVLLSVVSASCQLTTAAAHAGDYPAVPVRLLRSLSYDLRVALGSIERSVIALSSP